MRNVFKIMFEMICLFIVYQIDFSKFSALAEIKKEVLKGFSLILATLVYLFIDKITWFLGAPIFIKFEQMNKIFEINQTNVLYVGGKTRKNFFNKEERVVKLEFTLETFSKFGRFFLKKYLEEKKVFIDVNANNDLLLASDYSIIASEKIKHNEKQGFFFEITESILNCLYEETKYSESFYYSLGVSDADVLIEGDSLRENSCKAEVISTLRVFDRNEKECIWVPKLFFKIKRHKHNVSYTSKINVL